MNDDVIKGQVNHLADRHDGQKSQRKWNNNHDGIGLAGEHAVGAMLNQYPYIHDGHDGDDGSDFTIGLTYKVQVKTTPTEHLRVETKKLGQADIYVACKWDDKTKKATPVGWAWAAELARVAPTDPGNRNAPCHAAHHSKLRDINSLMERMVSLKFGEKP